MTFKFWKWRLRRAKPAPITAEPEADDGGPGFPLLTISVNANGHIGQYAFLPEYTDEQEAKEAANNFATMLFLLNDGRLLSTLQRAVSAGGQTGPGADVFAHLVLTRLSELVVQSKRTGDDEDMVVSARDTFGFNLSDEELNSR